MKKNIFKIIAGVIMVISIIGVIFTVEYSEDHISNNFMGNIPNNIGDMPSNDNRGDIPSDNMENIPSNENAPNIPNNDTEREFDRNDNRGMFTNKLTTSYILVIVLFTTLFSISLMYLLMSITNSNFYKNTDKLIIYILSNIILISVISIGTIYYTNNYVLTNDRDYFEEEEIEKDEVILDDSNIVNSNTINLDNEVTDVMIKEGGEYTFSGTFTHSIIIDSSEEVNIILDNVTINNENTAAIIGLSQSKITITLEEGSVNRLTDGGNSEYDGCIFSNSELVFEGSGTLYVNGNQSEGEGIATEAQNITFNEGTYIITSIDDGINAGGDGATITINNGTFYINAEGDGIDSNKDAVINGGKIFVIGSDVGGDSGIDTDSGYTVNGGVLVALGTDMIETPKNDSSQNVIAFTLDSVISKDTIVTLTKDDDTIVSFQAPKSFKTIIISSSDITNGTYSLYKNGSHTGTLTSGIYEGGNYTKGDIVKVNNTTSFNVSSRINLFGSR